QGSGKPILDGARTARDGQRDRYERSSPRPHHRPLLRARRPDHRRPPRGDAQQRLDGGHRLLFLRLERGRRGLASASDRNGSGPFRIVNNHLEAAGENLMFGGADPAIPQQIPSDIEICHNHFFKPLTWKADDPSYEGTAWTV